MNPVDEFLLAKQAAGPIEWGKTLLGAGKDFGGAVGRGVATGLGAAMAVGTGVAVKNIYDAATAKRDFRQMLEWNQDLHHTDQRLLNQSFRTLRRFAPAMSKDPLVSGSLVRRMMESPAGAAGLIHEAIGGEKDLPTPIMHGFEKGVELGEFKPQLHRGMEITPVSAGVMPIKGGRKPVPGMGFTPEEREELLRSSEEPGMRGSPNLGESAFGGGRARLKDWSERPVRDVGAVHPAWGAYSSDAPPELASHPMVAPPSAPSPPFEEMLLQQLRELPAMHSPAGHGGVYHTAEGQRSPGAGHRFIEIRQGGSPQAAPSQVEKFKAKYQKKHGKK